MASLEEALRLFNVQRFQEASEALAAILLEKPNEPVATHFLGLCRNRLGQREEALQLIERSVLLAPGCAPFYNNYGLVLAERGELSKARGALEHAVAIDPANAQALNNLGTILQRQGELHKAMALYEQAIRCSPDFFDAINNLATALGEMGRSADAIELLERHRNWASNADACINLAKLYQSRNLLGQARTAFETALRLRPTSADALNGLASLDLAEGQFDSALRRLEESLRASPQNAKTYFELGNFWRQKCKLDQAFQCFERCVALDLNHFAARWNLHMSLPVVYETTEDLAVYRRRWASGVEKMKQWLDAAIAVGKLNLPFTAPHTNFYLHYQGIDVLTEQRQFSGLISQLAGRLYPQHLTRPSIRAVRTRKRIRVGFATQFFSLHTVFKLFSGWVRKLSRQKFELVCFHFGKECDKATEYIRARVDSFFTGFASHEQIIRTIIEADIDVLIFPEIGMDPLTLSVAALRLAPVQCMAWGHPVTSGLPTIDYFLSSELMEVPEADAHYSERLVRLPRLSVHYSPPDISLAQPLDVRDSGKRRFLCLQSLFKLLPQYDEVFPRIALQAPNAQFWFIGLDSAPATDVFRTRLASAFQRFGLAAENHVRIFGKMPIGSFFGLIEAADVILDSIGWSGGNTTLEAISFTKPIVTLPGQLMRSRHTSAILTLVGCDETIASTTDEYVAMAVRLAIDKPWRENVHRLLLSNRDRVYNDTSCIDALESFLAQVSR